LHGACQRPGTGLGDRVAAERGPLGGWGPFPSVTPATRQMLAMGQQLTHPSPGAFTVGKRKCSTWNTLFGLRAFAYTETERLFATSDRMGHGHPSGITPASAISPPPANLRLHPEPTPAPAQTSVPGSPGTQGSPTLSPAHVARPGQERPPCMAGGPPGTGGRPQRRLIRTRARPVARERHTIASQRQREVPHTSRFPDITPSRPV